MLPVGRVDEPYEAVLGPIGGIEPYTITIIKEKLPTNLTIDPNTGRITGTPTEAGTFTFSVEIAHSRNQYEFERGNLPPRTWEGAAIDRKFQIDILPARPQPRAQDVTYEVFVGDQLRLPIPHQGFDTPVHAELLNATFNGTRWRGPGLLPDELELNPTDLSGLINQPGRLVLNIQVSDNTGHNQNGTITINAHPQPETFRLLQFNLPNALVDEPYRIPFAVAGAQGEVTFEVTFNGPPPEGFRNGDELSGVPKQAGTYDLTVVGIDEAGQRDTQQFSLQVVAVSQDGAGCRHIVESGETLFRIAELYAGEHRPTVGSIAEANGIPNVDEITEGQELYIHLNCPN